MATHIEAYHRLALLAPSGFSAHCRSWRVHAQHGGSLVNLGSEMNMYRAHFHSALKVLKPSNLPPPGSAQSIIRNVKGGKSCQCLNLAKLAIPCSWLLCLTNIRRQLKLVLLILLLCSLPGGMPPQAYKCCRAEQKRTYEQAFISFTVRIYTKSAGLAGVSSGMGLDDGLLVCTLLLLI